MICPACGSEFPDEMPVCPYCQTHIPEHTPDVHAYDAYYCADTVSLRKNHWIDFFIGLLFVIALTVLAIFFQLQKPSLSTQIRRTDAAELAEICTEYPAETADDAYTQTLLSAIADLQQTYLLHNDQESDVLENLQKLAATENVLVREQACDAAAEMESNRLLQEMNRVRTQRQKRMLTESDTLTETTKLLADTYQESPDTYEADAPKAVKESLGEQAEQAYQVMLVNCNSYTDAIAQYNEERKDVTVNFLTTQDYTQVGVSSIYDPVGKQFSFIILLLP